MPKKKPPSQGEQIQVQLPPLQPDIDTTWQYYLCPEGFEVKIDIALADRTITLQNVMPWDAFIHGLLMGWDRHFQNNAELTAQLDQFIKDLIAAGRYTLAQDGGSYGKAKETAG